MAQLMPLPLTVSCFSKIQIGFTFLVPAHLGSPGEMAVKQVCIWTKFGMYLPSVWSRRVFADTLACFTYLPSVLDTVGWA